MIYIQRFTKEFQMIVKKISKEIDTLKDEMTRALVELIKIPAISPDNGGEGEYEKAVKLLEMIEEWPFDKIERYDVPDERAKNGIRPNILIYYRGENRRVPRLWILTHLDVVPPGDLKKWTITKPFDPLIKEGKIYGRGAEDNGQSLVASLYAIRSLMNLEIRPKRDVILAFVSDEETGSNYGIKWLMENHPELFRKNDLVLVPDGGRKDGKFIEIAEKSILWMEVRIKGMQVHGSTPQKGLNAHRVALDYAKALDEFLHEKYDEKDEIFEPPESTFELTISENDSRSPNVIPGEHRIVFDCRVLPKYNLDEILEDAKMIGRIIERKYRKRVEGEIIPEIKIRVLQKLQAPEPTPVNSKIVELLIRAIKEFRGDEPRVGGIGGGTFAAFFRKLGIPAVVWETVDEMAHQPNEYTRIENMVEDSKIMALLPLL